MSVWTIYHPSSAYSELISAVLRIASSQISHRRRSSTCSRCMHTRCGLRQDASAILLSVLMLRTLCGSLHRWCKLHLNFPMCCLTLTFRAVTQWIGRGRVQIWWWSSMMLSRRWRTISSPTWWLAEHLVPVQCRQVHLQRQGKCLWRWISAHLRRRWRELSAHHCWLCARRTC